LFSTTTGEAPDAATNARYRSNRRKLKLPSRPQTRNATSTFAASGCSSLRAPAARRDRQVRRGKTASMIASPAPAIRADTQSPVTGSAARTAAR
jgi:hypothetical protein